MSYLPDTDNLFSFCWNNVKKKHSHSAKEKKRKRKKNNEDLPFIHSNRFDMRYGTRRQRLTVTNIFDISVFIGHFSNRIIIIAFYNASFSHTFFSDDVGSLAFFFLSLFSNETIYYFMNISTSSFYIHVFFFGNEKKNNMKITLWFFFCMYVSHVLKRYIGKRYYYIIFFLFDTEMYVNEHEPFHSI